MVGEDVAPSATCLSDLPPAEDQGKSNLSLPHHKHSIVYQWAERQADHFSDHEIPYAV